MAKRSSKASRSVGAGRTTSNTVEPSARPPVAVPPTPLENPSVEPVAVSSAAPEPPAADVAVPLTAFEPLAPAVTPPRNALVETGATAARSAPQPPTLHAGTTEIDETIRRLTRLHRAITGRDVFVSRIPYAPIPAKKDPVQHIDEQIERLLDALTWFARQLGATRSVASR